MQRRRVLPLLLLLIAAAGSFNGATASYYDDALDAPTLSRPDPALSAGPDPRAYIVTLKRPSAADANPEQLRAALPRRRDSAAGGRSAPAERAATARAAVNSYSDQLIAEQNAVIAQELGSAATSRAGGGGAGGSQQPRTLYQYTLTTNAFAVSGISPAQASQLAKNKAVRSVQPAARRYLATVTTPAFLGLPAIWQSAFNNGPINVLVGVVDSGVRAAAGPASFGALARSPDPYSSATLGVGGSACSEAGACTAGKIVACRAFDKGFADEVAGVAIATRPESDKGTCRDDQAHGSHVASIAAGSAAPAIVAGAPLAGGTMSGVAPGAAIAAYKVFWQVYSKLVGTMVSFSTDPDIVAAIEAAVADGADVINYSVGGGIEEASPQSPIWEAFRGAAAAGVLVAAAAGNDGPTPGTVDNPMPWMLTVAAGTTPRNIAGTVQVIGTAADGSPINVTARGVGISPNGVGPAPIYYAGPFLQSSSWKASLCLEGSLSSATVGGKIVVCERGIANIADKAAEVARAGGIGMVLINVNTSAQSTRPYVVDVPVVHLNLTEGKAIAAALASASGTPTATLAPRSVTEDGEAPFVASFSSRGPPLTDRSYMLKPDVLAPGYEIYAARLNAATDGGNDTAMEMSGTSMASPHGAGLAALVMAKHPTWSPAAVKSAIVTTASLVTNKGNPLTGTPFDYGAGHINPARALDPGLVYDAGAEDFQRYSCAAATIRTKQGPRVKPPASCKAACASDKTACKLPQGAYDLNMPSFAFPRLKRGKAVTARRTVTYVGTGAATFTTTVTAPKGFDVRIEVDGGGGGGGSATLAFSAPGETKTYTLYVEGGRGADKGYAFGAVTWADAGGRYAVRSPIAAEIV